MDVLTPELVLVAFRAVETVVVNDTTTVVNCSSGVSFLADATAAAEGVAASGPLPTAGTMPICFEVTPTELSPITEEDDKELVGDGKAVVEKAGVAVEKGAGGFVWADATSPAGIVAASGPLPTAGTLPTCLEVIAAESWPSLITEAVFVLKLFDKVVVKGSGGAVFADTISSSSIFAAPGPLPAAGTEPICFVVEAKVA